MAGRKRLLGALRPRIMVRWKACGVAAGRVGVMDAMLSGAVLGLRGGHRTAMRLRSVWAQATSTMWIMNSSAGITVCWNSRSFLEMVGNVRS